MLDILLGYRVFLMAVNDLSNYSNKWYGWLIEKLINDEELYS